MCDHISDELLIKCGENVLDLAISNVKVGGLPFAAIIVNQKGEITGKGANQVATHLNCTAHPSLQQAGSATAVLLAWHTIKKKGIDCNCVILAVTLYRLWPLRSFKQRGSWVELLLQLEGMREQHAPTDNVIRKRYINHIIQLALAELP